MALGTTFLGSAAAEAAFRALDGAPSSPTATEAVVAELSQVGRELYNNALARGPYELLDVTTTVIEGVSQRPTNYANLCAGKKRGGKVTVSFTARADHNRIRFTVYTELQSRLGYAGRGDRRERVPLPAICEAVVKTCFPGDEDYTGFVASAPPTAEERAAEAAGAAAAAAPAPTLEDDGRDYGAGNDDSLYGGGGI